MRIYNSISEAEEYMRTLQTKELGGDLLFFRNSNDCLTIARGTLSNPIIINVEGEWTPIEKQAATNIYKEYSASRR